MSKALTEQINKIRRISKLTEGYTMDEVEKDIPLYEEEPDVDLDMDMEADPESEVEGGTEEGDPFADEEQSDEMDVDMEMDDAEGDEGMGDDDVVELDVTDIIQKSDQALEAINNTNISIDSISTKLDDIYSVVGNLTNLTNVMNDYITNIAKDVDIMKPPTEEEKKEAMEKTSYPFNTSIEDYKEQKGIKTQTDLENKNKEFNLDDISKGYNERDIRNSFSSPKDENEEALRKLNNRLANYRN